MSESAKVVTLMQALSENTWGSNWDTGLMIYRATQVQGWIMGVCVMEQQQKQLSETGCRAGEDIKYVVGPSMTPQFQLYL